VTVGAVLARAARRLADAGIDTAELDAELLLRHVLGWDRATIVARGVEFLSVETRAAYERLVDERARRYPLQHLTGVQHFWRHAFAFSPTVLIPRPETELLVEAGRHHLYGRRAPLVVDVGTGSGCIVLSLAAERPDGSYHATDTSGAALAVARDNARRLGFEDRVHFHEGDLLQPVEHLGAAIDLVVSNPPYVDATELPHLQPEVRDHEPHGALVPPGDRYSVYRRLAPAAAALLRPGGVLVLEVGQGMAEEVGRICGTAGLEALPALADLQGIPRAVVARRGASPG
jgi:release factor glutamine methyltransferase